MDEDRVIGQDDRVAKAPARDTEHSSEPNAEEVSGTGEGPRYARPLGVTILAVLFYVMSVLAGGVGLHLLVFAGPSTRVGKFFAYLLILAIFSIYAAAAMGLWRQKAWGRRAALAILLITAVLRFPAGTIIAGPVLVYLARFSMERYFD